MIARDAAALVAFLAAGHAFAQDVQGTVFELVGQSRVPAANAFVIVHWTGRRPGLGHYESVCIQAALGRTDAQGRFQIREPTPLRSTFLVWRNEPYVAIYKPGFDASGQAPEWTLAPTKYSAEQRASQAGILSRYGCSDDKGFLLPLVDAQGVLADYRAALEKEMDVKPSAPAQVRVLPRERPVYPAQPSR